MEKLTNKQQGSILSSVNEKPVQTKLTSFDPRLIIGLIVLFLVIVGVIAGIFLFIGKTSKSEKKALTAEQTKTSPVKQESFVTYSNFEEEFDFQVPENWKIKEKPDEQTIVSFFSPKENSEDKFIENIGLTIGDLSIKPDATLDEVVKAWTDQSEIEFPESFKVITEEKIDLNGLEAQKIVFTAADGVSPFKGMAVFAIKDTKAYILVYSAEEKSFDKFLGDAEKIFESLNFGPQEVKWETYKSEEYGYKLKKPVGWKVTDTPSETSREVSVVHPQAKALVLITALKDEGLKDIAYMKESMAAFKEKLENDPSIVKIVNYKDSVEGDTGGFIAVGEEKREGKNWYFEQRGLLFKDGKVMLFHGAAELSNYKKYKSIISQIMESFQVTN